VATKKRHEFKVRTIPQLNEVHEYLLNQQINGQIDSKSADSINTTLKGCVYLNGKLKLDAAKLLLQAKIKKIDIPDGMFPQLA